MTIPTLLGFDDTIGPGLAKVAETVANVLQPYKQTEIELRNAIAKNPAIAQQLADLEYSNPGSLGKVFGPNVSKYAQELKPSVQAKVQTNVRDSGALDRIMGDPKNAEYLAGQVLGFQPSQVAKESEALRRLNAMEDLARTNPQLAGEQTFKDLLGQTRSQYELEQAQLKATQGAEAFLTGKGANLPPNEILGAILGENPNLKISTREVGDLFNSPVYGNLFRTLMTERLADRREELRLKVANAQTKVGMEQDLTKLKVGRALQRATEIENANPAAVAAVLYGPNDPSVSALGGITDPKDPMYSHFQSQITEAKKATEREGAARDVKRIRDAQASVVSQQKILSKLVTDGAEDAEIAVAVNQLNSALEEAGKLTGRTVIASYVLDPDRFFAGTTLDRIRNKGIYYFDQNGNPITEASVPVFISGGEAEKVTPPKKDDKGAGTAAIGNSASGDVGRTTTTRESSSESVTISAKNVFPNAKPELVTQMDRIGTLPIKEREQYYQQVLQQNPNLTQEKKNQLRQMWKLDGGNTSGETIEQAAQRVAAAFDRSEQEGEDALREIERTRGNEFHDEVASNIPAR